MPPGSTASMISARPVTADSGMPPASALAVVIRSGTSPSCSLANMAPVRPKPVWISSAMNTMPCLRANSATPGRKPSAGTMNPPSPEMGSATMQATLWAPIWVRTISSSAARASSAARSGPPGQR